MRTDNLNNNEFEVADVAAEDIDQNKYTQHEDEGVDMYSYRDAKWRWYNGQKRNYSSEYSEKPEPAEIQVVFLGIESEIIREGEILN